jgi:CTP-dependent riboflavin kinase
LKGEIKMAKQKQFWDVETTVCEVELNEKNKIIIKKVSKKDKNYVDVRKYFLNKEDEWQHGKGIAIPEEHAEDVAEIIKGAGKEGIPF